ncbi:MAG: di-trans,poly-cis-decaprenylcistransferase [Candidatus Woykebacteria bacterium RBG_19FT_COMBO_43_10]|uniref:Isoprenyl transferase n=1 Tax=Candidatus Woykebacteria bacterium RBG_19FT_COMBO_43_10 TaxID=1802598 RepID=A0A1G1WJQ6_9BACT|nr:MAG: di-trans,poly-cis-decaprenylcistransferase [Candidatus Woykebacteria bacterium RBG_19FT_COMBO_43_10]
MSKTVPEHVAIIMDGNRRWAQLHGLPFIDGHRKGVDALVRTVKAARTLGIKHLTFYALSTENYQNRSKREIRALLKLIEKGLGEYVPRLKKEGAKLRVIGNTKALPIVTQWAIKQAEKQLSSGKRLILNLAINYGGRREILTAAKSLAEKNLNFTEEEFEKALFTHSTPEPEIIIRTGGRKRLSNFLIWQGAYSELYFIDTLWPDFGAKELQKALKGLDEGERNFGR